MVWGTIYHAARPLDVRRPPYLANEPVPMYGEFLERSILGWS